MKYLNLFNQFNERIDTKTLYVDTSTIPNSGLGLFAKKSFKSGDYICKFTGELINNREFKKRDVGGPRSHYFIDMSSHHKGLTLDVYNSKSIARYANDAEGMGKIPGLTNNATIYTTKSGYSAYLSATKDIESGEEIFVNYGEDYWNNFR